MRGEHDIGHGEQVWVDRRLALKNIQPGCSDLLVFQSDSQSRIVHNAAAGQVDQIGGWLHQRQLCSAYGVVRFS